MDEANRLLDCAKGLRDSAVEMNKMAHDERRPWGVRYHAAVLFDDLQLLAKRIEDKARKANPAAR